MRLNQDCPVASCGINKLLFKATDLITFQDQVYSGQWGRCMLVTQAELISTPRGTVDGHVDSCLVLTPVLVEHLMH
jgi:hypothetical protein